MTSRTRILIVAVTVLGASLSHADDELNKLKASYEAAVTRAVAPIKATYEKELQKLLQLQTQASKLDAAAEVMAELKGLAPQKAPPAPGAAAAPASAQGASLQSTEHWFVGKTWTTPAGTRFSFARNGSGFRENGKDKTAIVWHQNGDGMVEVTGQGKKGGKTDTWFFRFTSLTEGHYGSSSDNLSMKLERPM